MHAARLDHVHLSNTVQPRDHSSSCPPLKRCRPRPGSFGQRYAAGAKVPLARTCLHLSPCLNNAAGLDQALLGNAVQTGDKSKDDQHIHDLVKLGAHLLVRLPAWLEDQAQLLLRQALLRLPLPQPLPQRQVLLRLPLAQPLQPRKCPWPAQQHLRPPGWHPPAPRQAAPRPLSKPPGCLLCPLACWGLEPAGGVTLPGAAEGHLRMSLITGPGQVLHWQHQ